MPRANAPFREYRLEAARSFAQTMIIVDDQATQTAPEDRVIQLRPPKRLGVLSETVAAASDLQVAKSESAHALDAKSLIDNAMELGLVCSVLRPKKGENIRKRVKRVARCADIVCLDWEIYGDSGASATTLIKDIVLDDVRHNGRLRLIAIYTGDTTNNKILDKISDSFSPAFRSRHDLKQESLQISTKTGLKIVCLFKAHGIQLPEPRKRNQVSENALPARLQSEFASLAEGLLSNVAMATIASIRSSTHHVLGRITARMDGPYFHHRAILPNVVDAEEYAVDVVLSELKSAVDKQGVARTFAGPNAVSARIREMAATSEFTLKYVDGGGTKAFALNVDNVVNLIKNGYNATQNTLGAARPGKKAFLREITTLFSDDRATARTDMHQFAILTGVRSHPAENRYKAAETVPPLALGTIVQDPKGQFLLCLQASCDSVRLTSKTDFLFIPLEEVDESPDHVVPISGKGASSYVGLSISRKSYARVRSVEFQPSVNSQTVVVTKILRRQGFYFVSTDGVQYRWIANLKSRRALRTAQQLGQDMGRLGFDEFEPFRKSSD